MVHTPKGLSLLDEADEQQQHDGPDGGGERATDQSHLDGEGGQAEQEAAADVARQAEAAAAHQPSSQPAGDGADEQKAG